MMVLQYMLAMVLILILGSVSAQSDLLIKKNPQKFRVKVRSELAYWGEGTAHVDFFTGHYSNNLYQKVISETIDTQYRFQSFGIQDSCLHYVVRLGKDEIHKNRQVLKQSYELEVYDVEFDFSKIDTLYPYNKNSQLYKNYTGSNKPFIDVESIHLSQIADSLWILASSDLLNYAEKCYEYVASNYHYLDPITGFHPLEDIEEHGGGDCGNLCSVLITLLRIKGIPSRHLVGNRPDGSLHVWADFYLERYGWIPVDVTYKQSDLGGNYFGSIRFENTGFILQRGIAHVVQQSSGLAKIAGLQTYSYSVDYSDSRDQEVDIKRKLIGRKL